MTMYLPNPDLHSTGYEPGEFIETPAAAGPSGQDRVPTEQRGGSTVPLDQQSLLDIARWAEEYISGLVENRNGGPEDVRSVIHQLHDQMPPTDDHSV